jgi:hypothetical protein
MAAIAELKALAQLDGKQFDSDIKKLGNSVDRFGAGPLKNIGGMIAGAFSIGALTMFGRKLLKTADDLQTAASTFDVSLSSMIAFKSAMAESGIGADRFMRIFGKLNSSISEAQRGVTTYTDAFQMMNISQRELAGLGMDEVLALMAQKYEEAGDKQQFLAGVSKAFGERIGPQLIEVFQRLNREGLDKFKESAEGAAQGISELAKASDMFEKLGNDAIIWAGKTVGAILSVRSELDKFVTAGGVQGWWQRLHRKGPVFGMTDEGQPEGTAAKIEAAKTVKTETPSERRLAGLAELEAREQKALREKQDKILRKQGARDEREAEKRDALYEQQDELARSYAQKMAEIEAGKVISAPGQMAVDALQRVGGIVGGVAGGDQRARIEERQAKTQEAIRDLTRDTNAKLEKIDQKLFELVTE